MIDKSTGKSYYNSKNIIERKNQSIGFLLRLIIRGCTKVYDTYGSIGSYGASGKKCATNEVNQESIDYLSKTPFIKYGGIKEIKGYKLYSISYVYFPDGRFKVEYKAPEGYWVQSVPELDSITDNIHAYNILYINEAKWDVLNESICEEYKLTCYRGEEQKKEIIRLKEKQLEDIKKEIQSNLNIMNGGTIRELEEELEKKNKEREEKINKDHQEYLNSELKKDQNLIDKGYVVNEEMTKINCPHNGCKSYCLDWGDPNDPLSDIGGTCMTVYYTTNPDEE